MPVLNVLLDASNNILGTVTVVAATGTNPPASAQLVAGPGQRLSQITLDDKTAALDAVALHAAIKANVGNLK
jgi:hypothetical protein